MSNAAVHDVISPLEPLDSVSLSEQVYGRLRSALMRAELKPDQRLKIRDLAAKLGTSETPVREAIFQLAREGALEIKPRYFVRRSEEHTSELQSLMRTSYAVSCF